MHQKCQQYLAVQMLLVLSGPLFCLQWEQVDDSILLSIKVRLSCREPNFVKIKMPAWG